MRLGEVDLNSPGATSRSRLFFGVSGLGGTILGGPGMINIRQNRETEIGL